jgi:hypothetical protein
MKKNLFIILFSAFATLASAQLRSPYSWTFPLDSLTNVDTSRYVLIPTDKYRQFISNYDIAGYIKKTEVSGNEMGSIQIQEKFSPTGAFVTVKTYTFDTTKTTENILIQHTTRGLATRIDVYGSGTGKVRLENVELIGWLRSNGLWWSTNQ